jgi:hypothetical protein
MRLKLKQPPLLALPVFLLWGSCCFVTVLAGWGSNWNGEATATIAVPSRRVIPESNSGTFSLGEGASGREGVAGNATIEVDHRGNNVTAAGSISRNGTDGAATSRASQYSPSMTLPVKGSVSAARKKKKRKSLLQQEGKRAFSSFFSVTRHASSGIVRAVNITGTTTAALAGGVFKVAGAAVIDASEGLASVQDSTSVSIPILGMGVRAVTSALRDTGGFVYKMGEVTENVTAGAASAAGDFLRYFVEGTIDNVEDTTKGLLQIDQASADYFDDVDASVIEHVVYASDGVIAGGGELAEDSRQLRRRSVIPRPRLGLWFRAILRRTVTLGTAPSMRFQALLTCMAVLGTRVISADPVYSALSLLVARFYLKAVEGVYSEALEERLLQEIKVEAVNRLQAGAPDRARSLNAVAAVLWKPILEPRLSALIQRRLNILMTRILSSDDLTEQGLDLQPHNVTWVMVSKVRMGPVPPSLRYMLVQDLQGMLARPAGERNSVMTSMLELAANKTGDAPPGDLLYAEMGVDYASMRSKLTFKLGLPIEKRSWWSVGSYVPSYRIRVGDVRIKAKLILGLQLRSDGPYLRRLWLSCEETPLVQFSIEAVTGLDLNSMPFLRRSLQQVVMRGLAPMCQPRYICSPILSRSEWEELQGLVQPTPMTRGERRAERRAQAAIRRARRLESRHKQHVDLDSPHGLSDRLIAEDAE